MLFLVISTPRAEPPSSMRSRQARYWKWFKTLLDDGIVQHAWVKCGRGACVILDVDSNETLHVLVNQWQELVPAQFQIVPLVDRAFQAKIAASGANPLRLAVPRARAKSTAAGGSAARPRAARRRP